MEKLLKEIKEIEDNIDSTASKEELYDSLVIAYYKYKDVVAILQNKIEPANCKESKEYKNLLEVIEDLKFVNTTLKEVILEKNELITQIKTIINDT